MDKIFIRDLRVQGILGVYDWERQQPREILINVELFTDTRRAAETDDLADCVDYSQMAQKIRALVAPQTAGAGDAGRFTVEALAEDIANLCLNQPRVQKVTVRVEKPGAVEGSESVGVEIIRKESVQTSQVSNN
ncbi:MAG: dihydroneopterin aldolase [Chloroflexi bacterium]|nr:dihydroneopterin aldolase [Chloroflexota bacterium]